jgi:hypothetical protein
MGKLGAEGNGECCSVAARERAVCCGKEMESVAVLQRERERERERCAVGL